MTRVDELYQTIAAANAELETIRKGCAHPAYEVGWWSWRLGSTEPARICLSCRTNVSRPSQAEINDFMAAEKARQAKFLRDTYSPEEVVAIEKDCPYQDVWSRPL